MYVEIRNDVPQVGYNLIKETHAAIDALPDGAEKDAVNAAFQKVHDLAHNVFEAAGGKYIKEGDLAKGSPDKPVIIYGAGDPEKGDEPES